jgi:putative oxidoreductase
MTSHGTTFSSPAASAPGTAGPTAPASSGSQPANDSGLLLLRLVLGLTMAAHGAQKLFGWFDGPGLKGTEQFFSASGYPASGTMALVAGLTETFGGLGLAVGLLTPLAGAAVLGTMINALALKWGGGFFAPQGTEYELLLAASAAALTLTGPGRYAADRLLPGLRAHSLARGAAALALAVVTAAVVLLVRR